jgi:CRISPR-associated protein Cas1
METIFIDRRGTNITLNHGRLCLKNDVQTLDTSIPLMQIRALVISCDCILTSSVLHGLAKSEISLICLNTRNPQASFMSVPISHGNIQRRINQYALQQQQQKSLRLAMFIVNQKIKFQKSTLTKLQVKRPESRLILTRAINQFPNAITDIAQVKSNQYLLGVEGSAARAYFQGFCSVFADSLHFNGRNKRPPLDPVNSVLSLSYTIMHFEALRACYAHGLEPLIGFLHQPTYYRPSLACDLMELSRHLVDRWVYQLHSSQTLRVDHFTWQQGQKCLLTKTGRKIYFEQLMTVLPTWRKQIRRHANFLTKYIDKTIEESPTCIF